MRGSDLEIEFRSQARCPLDGAAGDHVDRLGRDRFEFGPFRVRPTTDGQPIKLLRCRACGIVFKDRLPEPEGLSDLFRRSVADTWVDHGYGYERERGLVERFATGPRPAILDVGSSSGAMLRAMSPLGGRRSALDVQRNPSCRRWVTDEYVEGFLEGRFDWSGRPYDFVLAFDILEHLYDPRAAFSNLARFLREGGHVLLQTGDAEFPRREGASYGTWYYVNLLEHHLVWSERALGSAANAAGLDVVFLERAEHKDFHYLPAWKRAAGRAVGALRNVPGGARLGSTALGRDIRLLPVPGRHDHITAVLRKRSDESASAVHRQPA